MGNNVPPTSVVWEILNLSHANGIYIYITILVCVCIHTHIKQVVDCYLLNKAIFNPLSPFFSIATCMSPIFSIFRILYLAYELHF